MAGIGEEGGKVATSAIEGMKGNPLCLAVVVLTIVLAILFYLRDNAAGVGRQAVVTALIERCMDPAKR